MDSIRSEDYTFSLSKETDINPNTGNYDYHLHIKEFDVNHYLEHFPTEDTIYEIIESLMEIRIKVQKLPLPIPLKFSL